MHKWPRLDGKCENKVIYAQDASQYYDAAEVLFDPDVVSALKL